MEKTIKDIISELALERYPIHMVVVRSGLSVMEIDENLRPRLSFAEGCAAALNGDLLNFKNPKTPTLDDILGDIGYGEEEF